jgi:outer membrane immunogenic protein
MKRTAALLLTTFFIAAPAVAADYPAVKTTTPVRAFNWSGLYVGVHAGYAWDDADGWFAGGQIGLNYQAAGSPWVWGIELDGAFADIGESATLAGVTASSEANHFGTLRARVGSAMDRTLFYVTGGLAWVHNELSVTALGVTVSDSNTHTGWTIGAGVEQDFGGGWSWKFEYLYADVGSKTYFANLAPVSASADVHTVKLGVNYRFGY